MRARALVAIALLIVPEVMAAQRMPGRARPRLGGGRPAPAPLPPQPAVLKREMRFVQLPLSFESYPFLSYFSSSVGLDSRAISSWASVGAGSRLSLRMNPLLLATLDVTQALYGGPTATSSAELGFRAQRGGWEERVRPFTDVRAGYIMTSSSNFGTYEDPFTGNTLVDGFRYSRGVGGVVGGGASIVLGTRWFLTTGVHGTQVRMKSYRITGSQPPGGGNYTLRSARFVIGLTYNPVREIGLLPQTVTR